MEVGSSRNTSSNNIASTTTTKRPKRKFNIMNPFDLPGLRFNPTELDLVAYFMRIKIDNENFSFPEIHDVNIYDYNPQQLAEKFSPAKENEWYFFTSRERKYPNGKRPNRAAGDGYWKATGADEHITSDGKLVGLKKTLTFYQGKPSKGDKSGWIMNEFTVKESGPTNVERTNSADNMRLDKWILCRIHEIINRSNKKAKKEDKSNDNHDQADEFIPQVSQALTIYDTTTNNNDNNSIYVASNFHVANNENAILEHPNELTNGEIVVVEHSNEPMNAFREGSAHHINSTNVANPLGFDYNSAGCDQYYSVMLNGHSNHIDDQYISQVSQALQAYDINNNVNNNIYVANNDMSGIVEHLNEPMNAFAEESFHHMYSTGVAPLVGGQYFPEGFGINVENVTENVCHGNLGQTNPAAGGSLGEFDKNTQLVNVPQNHVEHQQNYDDFWDGIDKYILEC